MIYIKTIYIVVKNYKNSRRTLSFVEYQRTRTIILFHPLTTLSWPLLWRHNGGECVSNHQPRNCLLNRYSGADQRKHQSSASLAFVRGIHRRPVNSPHKGQWRGKCFHLMTASCIMASCHGYAFGITTPLLWESSSRRWFTITTRTYNVFFVVNLNKIKKNSWVSDLRRKTLMWLYCIGVLQGCHIVPHVYSSLNWITIGLDKGLYDIEPLSKPMMITHESQSKSQISTKILEINQPLTKLYLIIRSCKGVYWFLSVHPSPASCVRSVAPTVLVGSISYLYILSSDFRRCVACKVSFKIWIFGNFLKCVTLTLSY